MAEQVNEQRRAAERRPQGSADRRLEEALQLSEEHHRRSFEFDPLPIGIHADGTIVYANFAVLQLIGAAYPDQIVGHSIWEFAHPDEVKTSIALEQQKKLTTDAESAAPDLPSLRIERLVRLDGTIVEVEMTELPATDRGRPATQFIVRDVSERRRAERAVQESEEKFRRIFEAAPDAVMIGSDPDERIVEVNEGFLGLVGFAREEVIGRTLGELRVRTDVREHELAVGELATGEVVRSYEVDLQKKDGTRVTAMVSAVRLGLAGGTRVLSFLRDVTHQRTAEQELRAALTKANEADRLKSAFLANISHEIRTPLNVILGYTSLIVDRLNRLGDHGQENLLNGIELNSRRLINIVRHVLDFSKIEKGMFRVSPAIVEVGSVIQQAANDYRIAAEEKGLKFTWTNEQPKAFLRFDPHCLGESVRNLLDNAIKFTKEGEVTIRLHRHADKTLRLEVCDTGVGIDESYLPRLFDPFSQEQYDHTRSFEGAGLGLVLAKRYLDLNNARLTVASEKGRGSTFTIHFPSTGEVEATDAQPQGSIREQAAPLEPGKKPLVLVVEDDVETQTYMREALKQQYEVLVAGSARKARRHLALRPGEIRMILMDVSLRGGEDGLAFTRALRADQTWQHVPIIATTAHAFEEDRDKALAAGCNAYLAKPFRHRELLSLMEKLLG